MNNIVTMTNNNAMHTSVLNGNIQTNDMIPTVSNVSEQESGSSRKQRHSSFQKNQIVFYKKNGKKSKAKIRSVHFDDELVPYYTIELDGREKQTDSAHLEACSPSIPQEHQHSDTLLDPSPYVVVGSKRRKLNPRNPIEKLQPKPEASLSQEQQNNDTFYLLPRLDPSPYVAIGSKRRKLIRRKAVSFGFVQIRHIAKLSRDERLRIRKELGLKEMEEKNYRELEEEERIKEEMKRNSPKRATWDDNLQIQLIPRLSEDEDEIVSRNYDTVDGSSFVNDDEEDDRDDGYGEAIGDVVDVVEELTIVVNEKNEKKKKKSTLPRRSLRLQTSNLLGSGYTESGRRFSMRLKAMK